MLFRTRTAASRLLAAMWLKASSRSHSAFGLRLARIMSGGAKPPCSWPGPHSRASRRAVARALASSRLRTPRCPPRAPTASGSDMINDDSPVKVRPTVPQESSRARETLQATFATKGCRVPTPRSVWSAVPQGTAFDRRADLPVRVPMLRRCPACRKAPARAGAVHTLRDRSLPGTHTMFPQFRRVGILLRTLTWKWFAAALGSMEAVCERGSCVAANWRLRHSSWIRGLVPLTRKMAANTSSQLRRDRWVPLQGGGVFCRVSVRSLRVPERDKIPAVMMTLQA